MEEPVPQCCGCGKNVGVGAHRWAMREPEEIWHWDCAERAGLTDVLNPLLRGENSEGSGSGAD